MIEQIVVLAFLLAASLYRVSKRKDEDMGGLLSIDDSTALKGMSAFWVMSAHLYLWGYISKTDNLIGKIDGIIISQLGGLGVLIFFFLSGYGIHEGYGQRELDKRYIKRRFQNVYIPYVAIELFFLVVSLGLEKIDTTKIVDSIIKIVLMKEWFILVIMIEYLLYYAARMMIKKWFLILIAFNIVVSVAFVLIEKPARYYNSLWLFLFGIFVSEYKNIFSYYIRKYHIILTSCSFLAFCILGTVFALNKGMLWADLFKPLSGMALCVFVICIMHVFSLQSNILKWGGKRSLFLYVVHMAIHKSGILNCQIWLFLVWTIGFTELFYWGHSRLLKRIKS